MNPYKNHTLDELLLTPLNEEVFDRILEILDQKHRTDLRNHRETPILFQPETIERTRRYGAHVVSMETD